MSKNKGKQTPNKSDKGDKTRTTPTNELYPGILDNEWNTYVDIEQRDTGIGEIVTDIVNESLHIILERHTDRIAKVTAVNDVVSIFADAIRLNFISHDQESFGDLRRIEDHDLAPPSSTTDSWTRGHIQVRVSDVKQQRASRVSTGVKLRFNSPEPTEISSKMTSTTSGPVKTGLLQPSGAPEMVDDLSEHENDEIVPKTQKNLGASHAEENSSHLQRSKTQPVANKTNFKRYTGRVRSANVKNMMKPLDESEEATLKSRLAPLVKKKTSTGAPTSFNSMWKVMNNRPSNKDLVQFDEEGNVKSIKKLPSAALPNIQKSRPDIKIEGAEGNHSPRYEVRRKKTRRITALRPSAAARISSNGQQSFELAPGVKLIQGEYDVETVEATLRSLSTSPREQLQPMKFIQNVPLDHSAITNVDKIY